MRKFYLHTYDKSQTFDLNVLSTLATEPTGLGNNFSLSYKESEKGKHLTNVKPDFEPITLAVYFNTDGTSGYANYKSLLTFLALCGTSLLLFEYDDGVTDKFCDVTLQTAPKSEISEDGLFKETFTFARQSYWYERVEESFSLKSTADEDTRFPLKFPIGFRGHVFKSRQYVTNKFFLDAPVTVRISGEIKSNIYLYIETLGGVKVAEISLSTNGKAGTEILIDPTSKKITVTESGLTRNGYGLTDKTKQSFLYLPKGEYYIGSNMTDEDAGAIEISIRRYLFD